MPLVNISFLLVGLLGSLGLLALHHLGGGGLDDSHSHGLPHVTDSESSQGRIVSEGLHTHGLAGGQEDDGSISRLDELGILFCRLASSAVAFLFDFSKLR